MANIVKGDNMNQLKYDEYFATIIEDISYWQKKEDIPSDVLSFLRDSLERKMIFNMETGECHCSECMAKLEDGTFCSRCQISYQEDLDNPFFDIENIQNENRFTIPYPRYVFDKVGNYVLLYKIVVNANCYFNIYMDKIYKDYQYTIEKVYSIFEDGILDLKTNQNSSFLNFYQHYHSNEIFQLELDLEEGKLYTENLEDLKDTIYCYTYLWNAKEYLKDKFVSIKQLVFLPLYFPQFEYLMKSHLFSLAFFSPVIFELGKSFQELFGIDKQYMPFISQNNITYNELKILRVYPTKNIKVLRFLAESGFTDNRFLKLVQTFKINLEELAEYLSKIGTDLEHGLEYLDYLYMASNLELDLRNKKVLYPEDFIKEHDELFLATKMIQNPEIDKKIKNLSAMLSINSYEDNEYIIFPAHSIEELVQEGSAQHNCVRMYCEKVANGESQIYLLRRKKEKEKSFVTIEVAGNRIVQAKEKYNKKISEEISLLLRRWEKNLIFIESE